MTNPPDADKVVPLFGPKWPEPRNVYMTCSKCGEHVWILCGDGLVRCYRCDSVWALWARFDLDGGGATS